jgi:hypothetical protein
LAGPASFRHFVEEVKHTTDRESRKEVIRRRYGQLTRGVTCMDVRACWSMVSWCMA